MIEIRRRPREPEDGAPSVGAAIGVIGAIALSGLMTPFRGHLPNANMALALVLPVLVATVVGRGREYGRLVLFAPDATHAPVQKRLVAVAIADELGTTLATEGTAEAC